MYKPIALTGPARTRIPMSQYGSYKMNTRYYFRGHLRARQPASALPLSRTFYSTPKIEKKFRHSTYVDQTIDMTDKDNLDETEVLRSVKERDYYQDHTYYNSWIQRKHTDRQKKSIGNMFDWMLPGYEISPWVWYPGDTVEVVAGDFTGQRGTILNVIKYKNQAFVQNVNVQPMTIPASESRPEQIIQREHAINVSFLKLVDPSTNEPCDVKLVTVRDKETGEKVQRRMSLQTGTLMPIPKEKENVEMGDPINDTPLEDAREPTYMEDKELPVMIARKLRAMEDHFVNDLRESHARHAQYRAENVEYLRQYQQAVVTQAAGFVMEALIPSAAPSATSDEVPVEAPEFVSAAHWEEATADVELPEFMPDEVEDLHGVFDIENPRFREKAENSSPF